MGQDRAKAGLMRFLQVESRMLALAIQAIRYAHIQYNQHQMCQLIISQKKLRIKLARFGSLKACHACK